MRTVTVLMPAITVTVAQTEAIQQIAATATRAITKTEQLARAVLMCLHTAQSVVTHRLVMPAQTTVIILIAVTVTTISIWTLQLQTTTSVQTAVTTSLTVLSVLMPPLVQIVLIKQCLDQCQLVIVQLVSTLTLEHVHLARTLLQSVLLAMMMELVLRALE